MCLHCFDINYYKNNLKIFIYIIMDNTLFFKTQIGKFQDSEERKIIDEIRQFILNNYVDKLKKRSSLHEYIVKTDKKLQTLVNKIRHSKQIKNTICSQYENCDIKTLDDTDELYISHYNIDKGGDQGLYDKHYDGVLRILNNCII